LEEAGISDECDRLCCERVDQGVISAEVADQESNLRGLAVGWHANGNITSSVELQCMTQEMESKYSAAAAAAAAISHRLVVSYGISFLGQLKLQRVGERESVASSNARQVSGGSPLAVLTAEASTANTPRLDGCGGTTSRSNASAAVGANTTAATKARASRA
jgi:hypothetical protein